MENLKSKIILMYSNSKNRIYIKLYKITAKQATGLYLAHRTELVAKDKHIFDHFYLFSKFGISIIRARQIISNSYFLL